MGKLILARHHESEWNKLGKWTGIRDRHLTKYGFKKSEDMGLLIRDMEIDYAFASMQVRSIETLSCILDTCKKFKVPTEHRRELNERDYGEYTGKNKWDMEKILGEEEFKKVRRSWDFMPPNGESLKMVYERVVPFFIKEVLPMIIGGKNIIIVAHGNSLRALVKYIENISDQNISDFEFPFGGIFLYELDKEGHVLNKETRKLEQNSRWTKPQIIATIGPASSVKKTMREMLINGMDIARFNLSWSDEEERKSHFSLIREMEQEFSKQIPIIEDLPGPRVQKTKGHTYSPSDLPTERDKELIKFGINQGVDYIALSFVGNKEDVRNCRKFIIENGGNQKIISKIEREIALNNLEEIIDESDAIMVARGDLGEEISLEKIPFIQDMIIEKCKKKNKPVIVATQMMLSMKDNPEPTRAEVEDVTEAVLDGADAVMLSEETAIGKYPAITVGMMEKIIIEAISHMEESKINNL